MEVSKEVLDTGAPAELLVAIGIHLNILNMNTGFTRMTFERFLISRSMVAALSRAFDFLEFLQLGVSSNWFGLACPHHCGSNSFPSLALFLLLGICFGFVLGFLTACHLLRIFAPGFAPTLQASEPSHTVSRLRGYLV